MLLGLRYPMSCVSWKISFPGNYVSGDVSGLCLINFYPGFVSRIDISIHPFTSKCNIEWLKIKQNKTNKKEPRCAILKTFHRTMFFFYLLFSFRMFLRRLKLHFAIIFLGSIVYVHILKCVYPTAIQPVSIKIIIICFYVQL